MDQSDKKRRFSGANIFTIAYNLLGFISVNACLYGAQKLFKAQTQTFGEQLFAFFAAIVVAVLFFLSSYLIVKKNTVGFLIPIFLLSFIIGGGFFILLPLLIVHLIYFTRPRVSGQFSYS